MWKGVETANGGPTKVEGIDSLIAKEDGGDAAMLEFEALTLVPFDTRLLDRSLLSPAEQDWVDAYHRRVWENCAPLLEAPERAWLEQATRPLNP